ncbi:MAG: DUF1320 domain-containing protein [Meiothermus sp.]|nr:DUF1320 domain-containing protein [Meiothermus sp.]
MYATLEDIKGAVAEDVLVYLVDDERERTITEAGEARIGKALVQAESEVNSYVALKYALPLADVPEALKTATTDIAVYRLFKRRGIRPGTADEVVQTDYRNAVAWLRDIASGKATLTASGGGQGGDDAALPVAGQAAKVTAAERVFSRDKLGGF